MTGPGDEPEFARLVELVADTPWMTPYQGRKVWDHIRTNRPEVLLDVGTCYGTSAAYMAGACKANGIGRIVTVDSGQFDDQVDIVTWCRALWDRCEVGDLIEPVRISHSNYAWWLMEQVSKRTKRGVCNPIYDFVYLDGAKWLTLDSAAVIFIEQLLRPGGWLLMDDLDWSYAEHPEHVPTVNYPQTQTSYSFSQDEMTEPHLRAVFDLVVKRHAAFTDFQEDDGQWGWAHKGSGVPGPGAVVASTVPSLISRVSNGARALHRRMAKPEGRHG